MIAASNVQTVAVIAGPLVLLGYLVGAITFAYAARARAAGAATTAPIEMLATAAITTLVWFAVHELSPGSAFSRVALRSDQVLLVWQSVTLWTGLAVVVGHLAPITHRFRGGTGLLPAITIAFLYAPSVFSASIIAFSVGYAITRGDGRRSVPVALAAALSAAWFSWVFEVNAGWGVANGPEVTLWTMVVSGALFARWVADSPPADAADLTPR